MAPLSQTRRSRGFSPVPAPPLLKTALSERDDLSACPPAVDGECLSPFPFHGPFHGALPDPHRFRGATISVFHAPAFSFVNPFNVVAEFLPFKNPQTCDTGHSGGTCRSVGKESGRACVAGIATSLRSRSVLRIVPIFAPNVPYVK